MARATKVSNNRKGRARAKSGIRRGRGKTDRRGLPPRDVVVCRDSAKEEASLAYRSRNDRPLASAKEAKLVSWA
jgi:hypothetical protein